MREIGRQQLATTKFQSLVRFAAWLGLKTPRCECPRCQVKLLERVARRIQ